MVIGYIGFIFAHSKKWQGVFIDDGFSDVAHAYLQTIREGGDFEVPPLADADDPPPPYEGFVADLAAGLSRSVTGFMGADVLSVGTLAYAFHLVTGLRYFILTSRDEPQGGATTQLETLPNARSVEDARGAFGRHPDVVAFKQHWVRDKLAGMQWKPGHA